MNNIIKYFSELFMLKRIQRSGWKLSGVSNSFNESIGEHEIVTAKIAYVLGVDVFYLLTGEVQQEKEQHITIVKPSERRTVTKPFQRSGYTYESISHKKPDRLMDACIVTTGFEFPPEPMAHEGQELVFVLDGKQEFYYDGQVYLVEKGDCYYYDSNTSHYPRSLGKKPSKLLVVFTSRT